MSVKPPKILALKKQNKHVSSAFFGLLLLTVYAAFFLFPVHSAAGADDADVLRAGYGPSNIYYGVFVKILERADIRVTEKIMDYSALRDAFVKGEIDIACCASPIWRQNDDEKEVQLFTKPFFNVKDYYAVKVEKSKSFDPSNKELVLAKVRGWSYANKTQSAHPVLADSIKDALKMVSDGRADYTIINRQEFLTLQAEHKHPVVLTSLFSTVPIHIRVHKSKEYLIPKLNKSISDMKQSMEISKIIAASVRGKSH